MIIADSWIRSPTAVYWVMLPRCSCCLSLRHRPLGSLEGKSRLRISSSLIAASGPPFPRPHGRILLPLFLLWQFIEEAVGHWPFDWRTGSVFQNLQLWMSESLNRVLLTQVAFLSEQNRTSADSLLFSVSVNAFAVAVKQHGQRTLRKLGTEYPPYRTARETLINLTNNLKHEWKNVAAEYS